MVKTSSWSWYLVFTHLSMNEICHLRCLSKKWKHDISTPTFYRTCGEAHPIILWFVTEGIGSNVWVRMLDMKHKKWYTYKLAFGGTFIENRGEIGLISCLTREVNCNGRIFLVNTQTIECY